MFFVAAAAYREENSMNPIVPEQRSATTSKLTHIDAGKGPNFFGLTHAGEERKRTAHEQQNKRERFYAGRFNDHSVIMRLIHIADANRLRQSYGLDYGRMAQVPRFRRYWTPFSFW
jgi:hypothetical protein